MTTRRQGKYPDAVRERAVRLVFESRDEYDSEWAAISSMAEKSGMTAETLAGHLGHRRPAEELQHRLIAPLHQTQLHQHDRSPSPTAPIEEEVEPEAEDFGCQLATGASVAQVPEPRPGSVAQLPEPRCPV